MTEVDFETSIRRVLWHLAAHAVEQSAVRIAALLQAKYDPDQLRVPAGSPEGGQWTSEVGATVSDSQPEMGGGRPISIAARISRGRAAQCESMRIRDELQCRFVALRACWAQAALRYGNCLAGRPIPPLNY